MGIIDPRFTFPLAPVSRPSAPAAPSVPPGPTDAYAAGPAAAPASAAAAPPSSALGCATTLGVAASLTAAPAALALSDADCLRAMQNAASRGAEFHKERSVRIPVLMDRTVKIEPPQAFEALQQGKQSQLSVKLATTGLVPLRSRENVAELEIFTCGGDVRAMQNPSLASLLQDVEADGYTLRAGSSVKSETVGAYAAYNRLSQAWSGDDGGAAWLWRGEVPLMPVPADAGTRTVEVRDEIRRSRDALFAVQAKAQSGEADAVKDLALLSAPAGDASFATRATLLETLQKGRNGYGDARLDYQVVARSRRDGERLEDVGAFLVSLRQKNEHADNRDIQGAFNYTRTKLWGDPVRVESFQRVYAETRDINATVRAMDLLMQPVRGERYDEREAFLVGDAHAAQDIMPNSSRTLAGEQALDDYTYVVNDLRPGETFTAVAADYLAVIQGQQQTQKDISQVRPTFRYLRDKLASDPVRASDFREIVRHLGGSAESIRALEFIDKGNAGVPRDVRREVFVGLLKTNHDLGDAQNRYERIERKLQPGEDFGSLGKLYAGLLGDVTDYYNRRGVDEAFDFARKLHASDPQAAERFREVVRKGGSYYEAVGVYPTLQVPVRGESEADRVSQYLRIIGVSRNQRPADLYEKVAANLHAGESLSVGVDQMEALAKALEVDQGGDIQKAYVELKQGLKTNPDEMKLVTRLLQKLESYKATSIARKALDTQVLGETFEEREAVLDQLVDQEKALGRLAAEGGRDYAAVVGGRVGDEPLGDASARLLALLTAIRGKDASASARETFAWIATTFQSGGFGDKTPNEVTALLVESLLLNGDVMAARTHAQSGDKKTGTVEKQDDYVIIGGIKVPVQRNDS